MRFKSKESCSYLREETREEEDPRTAFSVHRESSGVRLSPSQVPGACQTEDPLPFARDAAEKIPPDPSSITATLEIPQSLLNSARPAGSRKHVEEVSVGGVLRSAITSKAGWSVTGGFTFGIDVSTHSSRIEFITLMTMVESPWK